MVFSLVCSSADILTCLSAMFDKKKRDREPAPRFVAEYDILSS